VGRNIDGLRTVRILFHRFIRLFKLSAAGGTQFFDILDHAIGNTGYVRNLVAADSERILFAGPTLFGRAFRLRFFTRRGDHKDGDCCKRKVANFWHSNLLPLVCDLSRFGKDKVPPASEDPTCLDMLRNILHDHFHRLCS